MSRYSRPGWVGKSRDENEPQIVEALEAIGCTVVRIDVLGDLLVGRGSKNIVLEVKSHNNNPNTKHAKEQKEMREAWKGQITVVENPMQAIHVITQLTVKNAY